MSNLRHLDADIAVALGRKVVWYYCEGVSFKQVDPDCPGAEPYYVNTLQQVERFSEDPVAMVKLIKEMQKRMFHLSVKHEEMFFVTFEKNYPYVIANFGYGEAEEMPFAVALAAHYALTGQEWKEAAEDE